MKKEVKNKQIKDVIPSLIVRTTTEALAFLIGSYSASTFLLSNKNSFDEIIIDSKEKIVNEPMLLIPLIIAGAASIGITDTALSLDFGEEDKIYSYSEIFDAFKEKHNLKKTARKYRDAGVKNYSKTLKK